MWSDFTPEQLQTLRRVLIFAIFLALIDVCLFGFLFYVGFLRLPY